MRNTMVVSKGKCPLWKKSKIKKKGKNVKEENKKGENCIKNGVEGLKIVSFWLREAEKKVIFF